MSEQRGWSWMPWLVLVPAVVFALRKLDNTDTWWHLASGRWIAQRGAVQVVDGMSFTMAGQPWTNLQWGFDLLLYRVFGLGGVTALVLLSVAVYTASTVLLLLRMRRTSGPLVVTTMAAWAVFVAQERFAIRPEMFSLLLLQLLLMILESLRDGRERRLWLLPPLMLVWVNLHALFAIGVFVIGCAAAAVFLAPRIGLPCFPEMPAPPGRRFRRRLLLSAGLGVAVCLANPYHIGGMLFPLELLSRFDRSSAFASISEFRSPFFAWLPTASLGVFQVGFILATVVLLAALVAGGVSRGGPRVDLFGLLVFAGLAVASLTAQRNAALFAFGAAPIVTRGLRVLGSSLPVPQTQRLRQAGIAARSLAMLLLAGATWAVASNEYYRWDRKTHESGLGVFEARFPVRAVEFYTEFELPGRLYNDLSLGGYLSWAVATDDGVFVDGRLEVFDEFFNEYRAGLLDPQLWSIQADDHGINSVMLSHRPRSRHRLITWLKASPEWSLAYYDETVVLFVRRGAVGEGLQRARSAFPAWDEPTRRRLREVPDGWRYPHGHALATIAYARASDLVGNRAAAAEFFARGLDYRLQPREVASYCMWLATWHASRGELERARSYLARARGADPDNARVRELTRRLGG